MSKAEKMFHRLGYKILVKNSEYIELSDKKGHCINIWIKEKSFDHDLCELTMQHHLALHEMFKELGWLE